eukprot:scaffold101062_cov20-Tisochrysis_lutea.AAC.1
MTAAPQEQHHTNEPSHQHSTISNACLIRADTICQNLTGRSSPLQGSSAGPHLHSLPKLKESPLAIAAFPSPLACGDVGCGEEAGLALA